MGTFKDKCRLVIFYRSINEFFNGDGQKPGALLNKKLIPC